MRKNFEGRVKATGKKNPKRKQFSKRGDLMHKKACHNDWGEVKRVVWGRFKGGGNWEGW